MIGPTVASLTALLFASPIAVMPASNASIEAATPAEELDGAVLTVLVERHAAPYFELTIDEAWHAFEVERSLTIDQVERGHYRIAYADGILDVMVDESEF